MHPDTSADLAAIHRAELNEEARRRSLAVLAHEPGGSDGQIRRPEPPAQMQRLMVSVLKAIDRPLQALIGRLEPAEPNQQRTR